MRRKPKAPRKKKGARDTSAGRHGRSHAGDDARRFRTLVAEASVPSRRASVARCGTSRIVVEDEPSRELLREMEIEPPDSLYGLYQGTPLTERGWDYGNRAARSDHDLPAPDRAGVRGRRADAVFEEVCAT